MFLPQSSAFRSTLTRPAETTLFHPDGSRTVIGEAFAVHYSPEGDARVVPTPSLDPDSTVTLRWDLAA